MVFNLSSSDAMDVIDAYGPDPLFWPSAKRSAIESMIATDDDLRAYVDQSRWIEDMLANWEQADEGAGIQWDEDADDDQLAEAEEAGEDEDEHSAPHDKMSPVAAPEDVPVEIDPDLLKDIDGMMAEAILRHMENANPDEFRVFTRDYDGLVDIDIPDDVPLDLIDREVASSVGPLMKDLRRLIAARSQVKRLPGKRSGRLHAPNLHRIMAGDDRVFFRREEAPAMDTAISLVIDCSGSMNGNRLKLAVQTAYAIGSVLNRLGVAFECLGFTDNEEDPRVNTATYKRELAEANEAIPITRAIPLIMPKFKAFDERWSQPVQRRFAHTFNRDGVAYDYGASGTTAPCGFKLGWTPEGDGVEFAARRLLARKEKRKIMIVMTDGEAYGQVYSGAYGARDLYKSHAVKTVKAVEASGIDLVGVGIQHAGPTGYYSNSMVIASIAEMPKQLLGLLKRFIVG